MSLDYRLRQFLIAIGSISLAAFSILLVTTADSTYNANFYSHFSPLTWTALAVLVISSLLMLSLSQSGNSTRDWRAALVLLFSGYAVLWEAPHILKLQFWAPPLGDLLQHYGITKYIIETGSVFPDTFYPLLHILLAMLSQITGVAPSSIGSGFTLTTTLMFALTIAALGGRLTSSFETDTRKFLLAVASTLVFGKLHHHIFPWFTSFQLIPLAVFLLDLSWGRVRNQRSIQVCLLLITISITLYHPMTAIVLLGVFLLYFLTRGVYEAHTKSDYARVYSQIVKTPLVLVIPLIHFIWYLNNDTMTRFLSVMFTALLSGLQSSQGSSRATRAADSGYTIAQLIWRYIILQYGPLLVFVGIGGVVTFVIFYRIYKNQSSYDEAILASMFYGGLLFAFLMLVGNFIANGPVRINQLTLMTSIILFGFGYGVVRQSTSVTTRRVATLVLVGLVLLVGTYTPLTIYNENRHVTEKEFHGSEWTLEYRTIDREVRSNAMTHKMTVYLSGAQTDVKSTNWAFKGTDTLPSHYGYKQNASMGEALSGDPYVVTKTRDFEWWKLEPDNRKPHISYQTRGDRFRLSNDHAANSIYSNGGFTVWRVNTTD